MLALIKSYALYAVFLLGVAGIFQCLRGRITIPLIFIIALLPLRNVIDRLHSLPMGKDFVDIMLIMMIIGWAVSSLNKGKSMFQPTPMNGIIFVMVSYTLLSLLHGSGYLGHYSAFDLSDPRTQAWKNYCILPLMFLLVYNNIEDEKWIWRIVIVMCVVMVLMDYYVVQQIRWYTNIVSRKKIGGTFVFLGPNEVAAFYNQYTVLLMCLWTAIKHKRAKLLLAGLIVINIFCILFLFSRAAYLGMAVGVGLLLLIRNRKLLIIFVLVLALWQTVLPKKVQERIEQTHDQYGQLDESAALRLIVWHHSMDLFSRNPVMGVGFGVFPYLGLELGDTHNIYLKILAEQGIIGFFIFLILVIIMFIQGIVLYMYGETEMRRALGLGFVLCLVVMIVNNVFGDRWTYMEISSNLWVFAALVSRFNLNRKIAQRQARARKTREPV